uniref:CSON009508 protein n=1 Tax=Culicoides sonorensis TaxID=179676 RepID=A0A336N941_CULSO
MSQLEKNQNSHLHNFRISLVLITIITIIDIIITTVNGLPLEASSSSSNLQNISSEKIAGIQKNNNYEIAEELKKCGLEKYGNNKIFRSIFKTSSFN